jgi:hypothetical protein
MVEWVPVVQGGMVMNSSKVRTRGLQHFHPVMGRKGVSLGEVVVLVDDLPF